MPPVRRLLLAAYPIGREVNRQTPACTHPASRREASERCRKECSASSPSRHRVFDSVRPLPGPKVYLCVFLTTLATLLLELPLKPHFSVVFYCYEISGEAAFSLVRELSPNRPKAALPSVTARRSPCGA
jgi:hypothetical protein